MPRCRAKENCFTEDGFYRKKGEVFEYNGKPHDSIEKLKKGKDEPEDSKNDQDVLDQGSSD